MADKKVTAFTELTTPVVTDMVPIIDDPSGSAEAKKVTVSNLIFTNPYKASAYKNGGNQNITAMQSTKITLGAENYDLNSNFDTTNSEYTVPVTGYYFISGYAYLHSTFMWGCYLSIAVDGSSSNESTFSFYGYSTSKFPTVEANISNVLYLTANQKVTLTAMIDNESGQPLVAAARLTIHLLSI